jgi:hypothetical protein
MGLIYPLFACLTYLIVATIDAIILLLILNYVTLRWQTPWTQDIARCIQPLLRRISSTFQGLVLRVSKKRLTETESMNLLAICLFLLRILIPAIVFG